MEIFEHTLDGLIVQIQFQRAREGRASGVGLLLESEGRDESGSFNRSMRKRRAVEASISACETEGQCEWQSLRAERRARRRSSTSDPYKVNTVYEER